MIKDAIVVLHERTGSSSYAIAKHMEDKYSGQLPANFRKILSNQLKNLAAKGKLVKVKASFKLSDAGKKVAKPSKEKKPMAEKEKKPVAEKAKKPAKTEGAKKRKAPAAVAKPKKKEATLVKSPKKVKKISKSPAKPKKPKTIKSPVAKKARVARR